MHWFIENKEWSFSGVAIAIISVLIKLIFKKKNKNGNNQSIGNLKIKNGKVNITQTINENKVLSTQIAITHMAILQMPNRLQQAADSGAATFNFNETRNELEKLYAIANSENKTELKKKLEHYSQYYNGYIANLNAAIAGKVTLDDVNNYFEKNVKGYFEDKIVNALNNKE